MLVRNRELQSWPKLCFHETSFHLVKCFSGSNFAYLLVIGVFFNGGHSSST